MITNIDLSHLTNEQLLSLRVSRKNLLELTQKLHDAGSLSTSPSLPEVETILGMNQQETMESPEAFRRRLLIDAMGELRPLEDSMDDWQREDYQAADQGWLRMATGIGSGKLRYYFERPKGHDKTTGQAHMVGWAMHVCNKPLEGVCAASTQDQARRLRDAIDKMVRRNPWLEESLCVNNYEVVNRRTGSKLTIITSDAGSNQGWNPDFVIVDELTVWKKRDLWDALLSAAAKKAHCILIVIGNAGYGMGHSWQWKLREYCREHPDIWHFRRLEGVVASWITEAQLRDQEGLLLGTEFQRVWLNQWVEESGESLSAEDIRECTIHARGMDCHLPQYEPFIAGVDLAVKKHHAALVVLGVNSVTGKVRVAYVKSWDPRQYQNKQIRLEDVRDAIREVRRRFKLWQLCIDPHQGAMMIQMLAEDAVQDPRCAMRIKEVAGVQANHTMALKLVDAFKNRTIELYEHQALRDDLLKLSIIEKQHHYSIGAPVDDTGHCDRAIALAIALPTAMEFAAELKLNPISSAPPMPVQGSW